MTSPESGPAPAAIEHESRLEAIRSQVAQKAGEFALRAQIAFHGVAEGIARHRQESAADVMEEMDHKEALYQHLGILATSIGRELPADTGVVHRDPEGGPPRPRTMAERIMDKRINKREEKTRRAHIYNYGLEKTYGGNFGFESKRSKRSAERAINKRAKREGLTERERIQLVRNRTIERPPTPDQKRTRKNLLRAAEGRRFSMGAGGLERVVDQPILSRHRRGRQQRAIGRIKTNYSRAQNHAQRREELERELAS